MPTTLYLNVGGLTEDDHCVTHDLYLFKCNDIFLTFNVLLFKLLLHGLFFYEQQKKGNIMYLYTILCVLMFLVSELINPKKFVGRQNDTCGSVWLIR